MFGIGTMAAASPEFDQPNAPATLLSSSAEGRLALTQARALRLAKIVAEIREQAEPPASGRLVEAFWRVVSALRGAPKRPGALSPLERFRKRQQLKRDARLVAKSGLFDAVHYAKTIPELGRRGEAKLLKHYLQIGGFEGRQPHPLFDGRWYARTNPDVAASGVNPLVHYLRIGALQGRMPNPTFDGDWYLAANADVAESGVNPLVHYVSSGERERRATYGVADGLAPVLLGGGAADRDFVEAAQAVFGYNVKDTAPTPLLEDAEPPLSDVRVVAFYLPQFHPIPENDRWWGKGFTEWSNVTRAQPQFEGHYQPHLPGELGFYDLRNPDVQRRQAALAATYGVSAFCIYFYWFNGHIVLERPLQNILDNLDLDQTFCLCWANENWTRRWDGLEGSVLLEQNYSADDDLAFIAHVSKYLKDRRYLRVNGRPALLVYRPQLLPSMKATAQRWRAWCRDNGVGDLYLICTHSFGPIDPADYGCDAAVEFPPNQPPAPGPKNLTPSRRLLNPEFSGHALDYSYWVELSRRYERPSYRLFRSVCPMWDNEARRPGRGITLVNSSPRAYGEWLVNAVRETTASAPSAGERLVFVNAWNEWAEGAHLEPDRRCGYAYLEATRVALARAYALDRAGASLPQEPNVAIVLHVFYVDIMEHMLDALHPIGPRRHLFITTIGAHEAAIRTILERRGIAHTIFVFDNRGRDVLPFLKALRRIDRGSYPVVLKLHTKKTPQRGDGDQWRDEILASLAPPNQIAWAIEQMRADPKVGLIGAAGHVLPVANYLGSNHARVAWLASRLGLRPEEAAKAAFVAGTMFLARRDALEPLINLALGDEAFEAEAGQFDGTMAHAVERAFGYSAWAVRLETRSIGPGDAGDETPLTRAASENYQFAKAT